MSPKRGPWTLARVATTVGGTVAGGHPNAVLDGRLSVDTRLLEPGALFLGLPGEHVDGGGFLRDALRAGAAGLIALPEHLDALDPSTPAVAVEDPHAALRSYARAWRDQLDCEAIGVTGAAGKTTTTDILAALLRRRTRVHATRHGFNTTQGVAATVAGARRDVEALVVEVAMHRRGDIATGAGLLAPTAAIVTNIGPEHLETAGTVADVARNKAELIAALPPGAPCVVPAGEPLLEPHLRADLRTVTHGEGGDVSLHSLRDGVAVIDCAGERVTLELDYSQPHRLRDTVAAVALARALGHVPDGRLHVEFSPLRWQPASLGEVELVLDCAKTSPLALASALADFAAEPASGRRIAVLGPFPDLGAEGPRYHHEAGALAARLGFDLLIAVGAGAEGFLSGFAGPARVVADPAEARALLIELGRPGDRALVKGPQRGALERIVAEAPPPGTADPHRRATLAPSGKTSKTR